MEKNREFKFPDSKITLPIDTLPILRRMIGEEIDVREMFIVLFLNKSNKLIGYGINGIGGIDQCVVDTRLIYTQALLCGATAIIVSHNHPSGGINPSENDKSITKTIKDAGDLLRIELLDHVIITEDNYYSFADNGLL